MATDYGLYGGYIHGASKPVAPSDGRFNPYDYIDQSSYKTNDRGQAQYSEDLAGLQYLAEMAQQDWQNAYNEARVADERAYQEKITADNRAYNERMIAEDREYNSYANQVQLMRQAGLNPDLLGVSPGSSQTPIASGQATGTNTSAGSPNVSINPMQGVRTPLERFGNVVSIIGSVAQTAMSLYSGGLSAVGMSVSNASSMFGMLGNALSTFDNTQGVSFSDFIKSSPLSNSQKKRISRFYNSYFGSPRDTNNYNRFRTKQITDNANYLMSQVNPMLNPNDSDGDGMITTKDWSSVWKPIFEAQYDEMKENLSLNKKSRNVQSKQYDVTESDLDYLSSLREPFRKVIDNMYSKYKDGNDFWGYALSALYMILNVKGVSFNSSQSPKGSKTSFNFGLQ